MPMASTAAAILAGGRARRFAGRDKSRLVVEGLPIIIRQLQVLQLVASQIFVVGPPERFADLDVPVYTDRIPGAGALGGIDTALEVADRDNILAVACDLPFLDAALLAHLVDLAATADAAWIRTPRGAEPLVACYRRTSRARVHAQLANGRLKLSELADVLTIAEMTIDDVARFGPPDRLLANLNTPDDYVQYER
jgi:molybdopterin-guanine dinucleotide biosynthesis protein A